MKFEIFTAMNMNILLLGYVHRHGVIYFTFQAPCNVLMFLCLSALVTTLKSMDEFSINLYITDTGLFRSS